MLTEKHNPSRSPAWRRWYARTHGPKVTTPRRRARRWTDPGSPWMLEGAVEVVVDHTGPGRAWGRAPRRKGARC